jgi:hypothetical protein
MLKRQLFYAGTTANTYQEVLCFIFGVDSQHYNEINGENQTSDCMNRSLVAVPGGTAQPPTPASPPEGGQSNNFGAPLEYSQPSDFETEPAPLSTSSSKERPERGGDYEITDPDTSKHGSSADAGSNTDGNSADAGSITDCKLDENGDLLDSSPEACKWTEQFSLDSMELRILDIYDCLLFISEAEIPWDYPTQADRPPTRENCIQKLFDGYKLSDATGLIASERLVFGATPQTPLNAHPILHGVKSLQEETEQIHACLGDGSLLEYDPKCLNLSDSVAQRLSYLLDPFNISKLSEVIKKILTPGVGPDYLSAMHEDNPTYQTILKMLNSEEEHSDEYLNFWNNALKSLDDAERTSMVKYALSYYFREFSLNYQWTALSNDQEVDIIDNIVNQGENLTVEQIATQLNGYLHNYATDILPNAYTQGFSLSFDRFMSDTGDTDDYYRGIISSNQGVGIMSTGHNLEALPTRNTDCAPVNYDANPNRPLTPATSEGVETDDIVCAYNVEELYNAGVDLIIEDDLYAAVQATYDDGYTPKLQFVKKIYINGNSYSVLRGGSEFIGHNEVAQPDGSIKDNGNYIDFVDSKHNPTLQLLLFGNANMSGLYRNDVQLNIDNKYDMPVVDLLTHKYPDIINIDAIKNTNLSFDCDTSNGIVYYNQEVNCSVNVNSSAKFDADNARIVSDQPLVVTVAFPQGFGFTTNFTGNFNIDEVVTEKEDTVVDNEEYVKFTLPAGSYVFDADNKLAFKLAPKVHHSSSIIYATVNDSNPIFANSLAQSIILGSNDEVGDVQCDHLSYEDLDNVKNGNYSSVIGSEMRVSDKSLKKCYVANFTNYPQRFRVGLTDDGDNSDANALTISSDIVVQPRSFASFNMTKEILDYLKGTLKESGVDTSYICPVGQFIHDGGVGQDINGNHSYTCVDADGQFAGSFAVQKQVTRYVSNANFTLDIFRATSKAYTCQDGDQLVDSLDGIDPNKLPPGAYSVIDISQYGCKAPVIDATGEIVPNEFNYFGYMGERPTGDTYIEAEAYDEYSCPEGGQVLDWGSTMVCMNYVTGSHRDAEVTHHDAVTKPIINHFVQEIPIEPGFYSVQTVFVVDKSYSYEKIVDSPGYDEYSCPEGGQVLEWGSVMVCMNYVTGSHRDAERKHQDEVAHWIKHDIISHPEQRDIEPTRFSEFVW